MAANLKEVRERIRSVNSTQQITKAMKMVSAAKLRRAQQAIQQMRPYAEKQSSLLRNILSKLDGDFTSTFSVQRTVSKACVVVVTSNRGLCGAFNTNVVKAAIQAIEDKYKKVQKYIKKFFDDIKDEYRKEKNQSFPVFICFLLFFCFVFVFFVLFL